MPSLCCPSCIFYVKIPSSNYCFRVSLLLSSASGIISSLLFLPLQSETLQHQDYDKDICFWCSRICAHNTGRKNNFFCVLSWQNSAGNFHFPHSGLARFQRHFFLDRLNPLRAAGSREMTDSSLAQTQTQQPRCWSATRSHDIKTPQQL